MLARHVSDLIGPPSGAFYELYLQIWYVVICVLLDTSSRYGWTCRVVEILVEISLYKHMQSCFMRCGSRNITNFTIVHIRRTAILDGNQHVVLAIITNACWWTICEIHVILTCSAFYGIT